MKAVWDAGKTHSSVHIFHLHCIRTRFQLNYCRIYTKRSGRNLICVYVSTVQSLLYNSFKITVGYQMGITVSREGDNSTCRVVLRWRHRQAIVFQTLVPINNLHSVATHKILRNSDVSHLPLILNQLLRFMLQYSRACSAAAKSRPFAIDWFTGDPILLQWIELLIHSGYI